MRLGFSGFSRVWAGAVDPETGNIVAYFVNYFLGILDELCY